MTFAISGMLGKLLILSVLFFFKALNIQYRTEKTQCRFSTNYSSQTTLLTTYLLTEVIEVTEDGSDSGYGKSQSIFLIMCVHQRKTAEVCMNFLHFRIYFLLGIYGMVPDECLDLQRV